MINLSSQSKEFQKPKTKKKAIIQLKKLLYKKKTKFVKVSESKKKKKKRFDASSICLGHICF